MNNLRRNEKSQIKQKTLIYHVPTQYTNSSTALPLHIRSDLADNLDSLYIWNHFRKGQATTRVERWVVFHGFFIIGKAHCRYTLVVTWLWLIVFQGEKQKPTRPKLVYKGKESTIRARPLLLPRATIPLSVLFSRYFRPSFRYFQMHYFAAGDVFHGIDHQTKESDVLVHFFLTSGGFLPRGSCRATL